MQNFGLFVAGLMVPLARTFWSHLCQPVQRESVVGALGFIRSTPTPGARTSEKRKIANASASNEASLLVRVRP